MFIIASYMFKVNIKGNHILTNLLFNAANVCGDKLLASSGCSFSQNYGLLKSFGQLAVTLVPGKRAASSDSVSRAPPPRREQIQKDDSSQDEPTKQPDSHLVGRDLISLAHFSSDDLRQFLWTAKDLKTRIKDCGEVFLPLKGKSAALLFQKEDTRTRLSAEFAMKKLGGHICYIGPNDIHNFGNESLKDTTRVVAAMSNIILASVSGQKNLEVIADESNVPVVNVLSDYLHPLQTLADFMTIQESFGYLRGVTIAWIGTTDSSLHSLMLGCAKLGIDLNIATPGGYEPDIDVTTETMKLAGRTGASFLCGNDAVRAAYRADVIITNSWASKEFKTSPSNGGAFVSVESQDNIRRLQELTVFKINRKMLKEAGGNWILLHGLPRREEEVADNIFYGEESLVWQSAENRLWTSMAVLLHLLSPYNPTIPMPKYFCGQPSI